jgi:hypothetical protein
MIEVLQRFIWNGTPKEIGDLFRVTKNRRKARAVIFSNQFGREVRLLVGSQEELVSSQVCRTQEEGPATGEQWETAMRKRMVVTISWSSLHVPLASRMSSGLPSSTKAPPAGRPTSVLPPNSAGVRSRRHGRDSHAASRRDVSDGMPHTSLRSSLVTRDGPFVGRIKCFLSSDVPRRRP